MRTKSIFFFVTLLCVAAFATQSFADNLAPGEFYPTDGDPYPQAMTNPNAKPRVVPFDGHPLDVYVQINRTTIITLPAPPELIIPGVGEDIFTIQTVPSRNIIAIKPNIEFGITNLTVVTEDNGKYYFVIKEVPGTRYDIDLTVVNPFRQINMDDPVSLVKTIVQGKRPPEFVNLQMDMRRLDNGVLYPDEVTGIFCQVTLRRVLFVPRAQRIVYWLQFSNVRPPDIRKWKGATRPFAIDERTVRTEGLERVMVAGTKDETTPMLETNGKYEMFLFVRASSIPKNLNMQMALSGSRSLPIDLSISTGSSRNMSGEATADQKLMDLWQGRERTVEETASGDVVEPTPTPDFPFQPFDPNNPNGGEVTPPEQPEQPGQPDVQPEQPGNNGPDDPFFPTGSTKTN